MSSDEVICLSSPERSSNEDEMITPIKISKENIKGERMSQKRKSLDISSTGDSKKSKCAEVTSTPEPGCSKNVDTEAPKKVIKPQLVIKSVVPFLGGCDDVFKQFVGICLERRSDKDTKKVIQKLEKAYNRLSLAQKSNYQLRSFINNCIEKITRGLSNDIYTPILELYTELKSCNNVKEQITDVVEDDDNEIQVSKEDMKKIKILERSIEACTKKIQELEEREVDFDEDQNSAYIQEDKYKRRLIQLYNSLSRITGDKNMRKQLLKKKIKRKDIPDEMTGISSVDEAILSFVNSDIAKVNQMKHLETQSCADHIKMPEYLDILKCIKKCNEDNSLDLSNEKMTKLAKRAFQAVGNFLKRRRMDETKLYIQSLSNDQVEDPALKDVELNKKLHRNKQEGDKKLEEIFKKYVEKQEGLSKEDLEEQNGSSSGDDSETDNSDDSENLSSEDNSIKNKQSKASNGTIEEIAITTENKSDEKQEEIPKDNAVTKTALEPKTPKNAENKPTDVELTTVENIAQVGIDEDVLVISDNETVDDTTKEQDPLDVDKVSENESPTVAPVTQATSPTRTPSKDRNVTTTPCAVTVEKIAITSEADDGTKVKKSFIKVRSFAKPSPAWADSSPEKAKKACRVPIQKALQDLRPEYIDLTEERENRVSKPRQASATTRAINPLAHTKRVSPTKRVVIVKNVINNYNVPVRLERGKKPENSPTVITQVGGRRIVTPVSSIIKHQRISNEGKILKSPWLSKDKELDKRPYTK